MNKLDILKKLGRAGLNLAGVQAGAGKDKVRALEAEKEILTLKLSLARLALSELIDAVDNAQARGNTQRVDEDEVNEARAALELIGRVGA